MNTKEPESADASGKGLHVTVPATEKNNRKTDKFLGAAVAEEMVRDVREAYVSTMSKAKRTGKICGDYFRNDYTLTVIADFASALVLVRRLPFPLNGKSLAN